MIDTVNNIAEIHKKNSAKMSKDYDLCQKYASLSQWIIIGIFILYLSFVIIYQLPAFFDIFTKGIVQPSLTIYLPGVDELNILDMTALLFINFVFAIFGMTILLATDTFILINFTTIPMLSAIIQRQINECASDLNNKRKLKNSKEIKRQLVEIISMQLKYDE